MVVVGGGGHIDDLRLAVVLSFPFLPEFQDFGLHFLQLDVVAAGFVPFEPELALLRLFFLLVDPGFMLEDLVLHLLVSPSQPRHHCLQRPEVGVVDLLN